MTLTAVYAEVRALRPITVGNETYAKGEQYCSLRFTSVQRFEHFRRNLRWSAFEVVKIEEKDIKNNTLADVAKVTQAELAAADEIKADNIKLKAELKIARQTARMAVDSMRDVASVLARLTPAQISWMPEAQAAEIIRLAQARRPQAEQDLRTAALRQLQAIDGIGSATAAWLHDVLKVTSTHRLEAVLEDPASEPILLASPVQISAKDLAHWRRQLEAARTPDEEIESTLPDQLPDDAPPAADE